MASTYEGDRDMNTLLNSLDVILKTANIAIIAYGLYKFLGKPHSTLEQRVAKIEAKIEDLERQQEKDEIRINDNEDATEAIQKSLLALIEFEIQFCISHNEGISDELRRAKDDLHGYLAHKR